MKRITLVATIGVFVATLFGALAMAQNAPLGDYARQARKQKDHQAIITLSLGNSAPGADTSTLTFKGTSISGQCDLPQRIAIAVRLMYQQHTGTGPGRGEESCL